VSGDANSDGTVNIFDLNLISSNWTHLSHAGDANGDGIVNIFDINLVSSNWGSSGPSGDANNDGIVNIFDVNLISSNWGATGGSVAAVPEPASWGLAVVAALALVPKVRRGCRAKS